MKRIDSLIQCVILLIIIFSTSTLIYKVFIESKTVCGSGFESAYIIWQGKNDIYDYNVYIKNIKETTYKILDEELVRKCKNGKWRADAIGLQEGDYQFKIVPKIEINEKEENAIESETIQVKANDRSGFSFSKNSTNGGNSSGGYLVNGEVAQDAKILYLTKENANNITLNITDSKNNVNQYKGICEILKNWNKENISKKLIIRVIGKIERQDIEGLDEKNKAIIIEKCKGVTVEGIGNDATLKGIGIMIRNSENIEIRNLGFMLYYEDAISIEKNNSNIWIHNNDFFYGEYREEGKKQKGDGAIDIKQSEYITIAYNHFWDNGKTSLCGIDKNVNYVTYHHNWFDHCDSRCPRVYFASVHCYNNYYIGNCGYSIAALEGASIFLEANYFDSCEYPMIILGQGSDLRNKIIDNESSGGIIKSYKNIVKNYVKDLVYSYENPINFDAYIVNSKKEIVPESYKTVKGDYHYNNFDTNEDIMYDYRIDNVENVKNIVINQAGRIQGGDILFNTKTLSIKSHERTTFIENKLDEIIKNY